MGAAADGHSSGHMRRVELKTSPAPPPSRTPGARRCGSKLRREGVPAGLLRLTCGDRELSDAAVLPDGCVRVLLRLEGGKGGFGAMLRTSGARGIKTTTFDACRDLNGRRLRHVNAEAQLREWEASAEERKQKKAEQRAREAASRPGPAEALPERFDDDAYEKTLEETRSSVADAFKAAAAARRRAAAAAATATATATTPCRPPTRSLRPPARRSAAPRAARADAAAAEPAAAAKARSSRSFDPLAAFEGRGNSEEGE